MTLVHLEQEEINLLALMLMAEEDREWKRIAQPENLESVRSLRRLLLRLPVKGLAAVAVRHHCKTKRLTYLLDL